MKNNGMMNAAFISVVCSIIASALYEKFIPFMSAASTNIVNTANFFYSGFIDRQYLQAVSSLSERILIAILLNVALIISGGVLFILLYRIPSRLDSEHHAQNRTIFYNYTELARNFVFGSIIFMSTYITIFNVVFISSMINSSIFKASFEKGMMYIAPIATDSENKNLMMLWSKVKSKQDYENVMINIQNISGSFIQRAPAGLSLPPERP